MNSKRFAISSQTNIFVITFCRMIFWACKKGPLLLALRATVLPSLAGPLLSAAISLL